MSSNCKSPITECPRCGNTGDFYTKERVSGIVEYRYPLDGQGDSENGSMYDDLNYKLASVYAFCADCHIKLFKLSERMDNK